MTMKPHSFLLLGALAPAAFAQPTPRPPSADDAYRAAYALVLGERWLDAERALNTFLAAHGSAEKADDAGFWRCYAVEKQGLSGEAFGCYNGFIADYPDTEWRDDSQGRLIGLASALTATTANVGPARSSPTAADLAACAAATAAGAPCPLAARSGRVSSTAPQVATVNYNDYLRRQRASPDDDVALLAIQALARPGADDAVDDLARIAAEGRSDAVRGMAARGLAQVGTARSRAALAGLVETAWRDATTPDAVRRAVDLASTAVRRGDETLVPALTRALRDERASAELREMAARGLGHVGTAAALEALVAFVEDGTVPAPLRAGALEGLNAREATGQASRLLVLFERTRAPELRGALARTLATMVVAGGGRTWTNGTFGTLEGFGVFGHPMGATTTGVTPYPAARDYLAARDAYARTVPSRAVSPRTVQGLTSAGGPTVIEAPRPVPLDTAALARVREVLLARLDADDTPDVYESALHILSYRITDGDLARLERFAGRPDVPEELRAGAVERIARADVPAAFAALRRLAERLDARPLATVAYAFGTTFRANPESVPVLARLARHADADVRAAAINALGRVEAPEARQALLDLIRAGG